MGLATALRRRVLRRHDHHRLVYLSDALLLARLAQATGTCGMVPGRDRRALGRDDACLVPALPVVVGMELEWGVAASGARRRTPRRLSGGRDVGGGEDGVGKAAVRRSPVPAGGRGR